jgi:hypothetical protein
MDLFIVSYDLIAGKNYKRIIDKLTSMGAKRVLLSAWVMRSSQTTPALRTTLQGYIDSDDRLIVIKVATWASFNALIDMNQV